MKKLFDRRQLNRIGAVRWIGSGRRFSYRKEEPVYVAPRRPLTWTGVYGGANIGGEAGRWFRQFQLL